MIGIDWLKAHRLMRAGRRVRATYRGQEITGRIISIYSAELRSTDPKATIKTVNGRELTVHLSKIEEAK